MDLVLITGSQGKVGFELAKYLKESGFEVQPILHDSIYSEYFLPSSSNMLDYDSIFIVHSGQPNAPRSRLQRKRYLSATKNLIEESKIRKIKFVYISSLSAHGSNRSNYARDKLYLEGLTIHNSGTVIKLGLVTGVVGSYTSRILHIKRILSLIRLDFLITSAPTYYTPVNSLSEVSVILQSRDSWGGVKGIFQGTAQTQADLGYFRESVRNIVIFMLFSFTKLGFGSADAFLSLIDGMEVPE